MQAADGKNFVDVPEGLSVPHETRHEPAIKNGSDRGARESPRGWGPTASSSSHRLSSSTGSLIWPLHRVSIGTVIADQRRPGHMQGESAAGADIDFPSARRLQQFRQARGDVLELEVRLGPGFEVSGEQPSGTRQKPRDAQEPQRTAILKLA